MSEERTCLRCGADEFRIHGYCSCECEDLHERELVIGELRLLMMEAAEYVRDNDALQNRCAAAFARSEWCAP